MKKSTKNTMRKVAIGTGVAAVVGAAAYALKDNPKVKKVAQSMKKDIIASAKKAKVATKGAYEKVAKEVAARYKKATHVDVWTLVDAGKEVKDAWEHIKDVVVSASKEISKEGKRTAKTVKKAVKKVQTSKKKKA